MKNITKNNSMLHRMIALVMAVVMTLTLVAIDSHFHLFADETEVAANEVDTIDVTNVLKGYSDGHEATVAYASNKSKVKLSVNKADIADIKLTAKVGDEDITVEGKDIDVKNIKYLTYKENATDDKDKLNKNPATPTDADKTIALSENVALSTEDNDNITYVALYYAYKKDNAVMKYIYMGTAKVLYDIVAPEIDIDIDSVSKDGVVFKAGEAGKDDYYLVNKNARLEITFNATDKDSEIDKIVSIKAGSTDEIELENDKFVSTEGSGVYTIKAYDKAGNSKELNKKIIVKRVNSVLQTNGVSLEIKDLVNENLYPGYYIKKDAMEVTVTLDNIAKAGDETTGIEDLGYTLEYLVAQDDSKDKLINTVKFKPDETSKSDKSNNEDNPSVKLVATFTIPTFGESEKEIANKLYVRVNDEVGNSTLWLNKYNQVVFIDPGKPSVVLSGIKLTRPDGANSGEYEKLEDYNGLLNKWANKLSLNLNVSNGYSYINKVTYVAKANGKTKKTGCLSGESSIGAFTYAKNVTIGSDDGCTIKLDNGEYDVAFTAESYAGTTVSNSIHVCIDNDKPELSINSTVTNKEINDNEEYTVDSDETLKLSYSDKTSGIASAKYKITYNDVSDDEWTEVDKSIELNDAGVYKVEIEVVDNAGNATTKTVIVNVDNVGLQTSLVVTREKPTIKSSSDIDISPKNLHILNWKDIYVLYTVTGYALDAGDIEDNSGCVSFGGKNSLSIQDKSVVEVVDLGDGRKRVEVLYHITTKTGENPKEMHTEGAYTFSINANKHFSKKTKKVSATLYYDVTAPQSVTVEMDSKAKIDRTYYYGPDVIKTGKMVATVSAIDDNANEVCDQKFGYKYEVENKTVEGTVKIGSSIEIPCNYVKTDKFYQLKLWLTDNAGNTSEEIPAEYVSNETNAKATSVFFYIDTEKPTFEDIYINTKKMGNELKYYNTDVKVKFKAKDSKFISSIKVTGKCDGKDINTIEKGKYKSKNILEDIYKSEFTYNNTFSTEGRYKLRIEITDEVGNTTLKNIEFVIDKTSPVVSVSGGCKGKINYITSTYNPLRFLITDTYDVDPQKVDVKVYYRNYDESDFKEDTHRKYGFKESNDGWAFTFNLSPRNNKSTVYYFEISGSDLAGNKLVTKTKDNVWCQTGRVLKTNEYFVVNDAPSVYLSDDTYKMLEEVKYFNESVNFNVYVDRYFSDIDNTLKVYNGDKMISQDDCKVGGDNERWRKRLNFTNQGEYNIIMNVVDELGNMASDNVEFFIDKTRPTITIGTYNKTNNSDVNFSAILKDNMKSSTYNVNIVRKDFAGNIVQEEDRKGSWENKSDNEETQYTYTDVFKDEGDYTITVTADDKAGNDAEPQTATFRIDKTAPVISISGMNDKQTTGVTATISIDEAFSLNYEEDNALGSSDFNVTITKKTDGTAATNVATFGTDKFSEGNPHTVSYNCSEDGEYTITASAMDLARNKAAEQTKTFKVDSKAPVLKVTAVDKDSKKVENYDPIGSIDPSTPNYVDMSLSVEEAFFATDNVEISVKKDSKDVSSSYFTNYRNSAEISTGTQRFSEDGVYEVSIKAQDELGNKADDYSLVFTVDNTPPELAATNVLDKFKAKTTKTEDGSILLNADDFADIINQGYEALWNVNDTSDFSVDAKIDGVSLIDFSDLTDGYHQLTIEVKDKVGHVSNDEFDFTYDGTAPRIVITGVEDGETVREPFTMTIGLENPDDEITSIVINGNTIDPANYSANNKYEMQVQDYDTYTIEVTAKDKAGNVASTIDEDTGAVFTFKLSEKLSPVVLVIIIIAAILLIALLIFIILASKRKKKNAAA